MIKKWFKDFVQTKFGLVVTNLVAAVVLAIAAFCILFVCLRHYTQHGVEVEVPAIMGLQKAQAEELLAEQHLSLVIVDSTFSNEVPLGTIVEQTPVAGSHTKKDRSVYGMINSSCRREIELPDLHDISYRQAQSTLRALGLSVGNTIYEPSEYKDIVLEIRCDDRTLEPGDKVTEGSTVTLVIGRGKGTSYVAVPSLQGKTLAQARSLLIDRYHLTIGLVEYDDEATGDRQQATGDRQQATGNGQQATGDRQQATGYGQENTGEQRASGDDIQDNYIVYQQHPTPGTQVLEGTGIDIKLSADVEKALTTSKGESEDEDFF